MHPWLERREATANRVKAEDETHIFGSYPDDSLEVLSEADTSLTQPSSTSQHACHVTVTGTISSYEEEEVPDSPNPTRIKRKLANSPVPAIW